MIAKSHRKLAFLLASLFALFTFSGCVSVAKLMGRKLKMSDITEKIDTSDMKAMDFTGKIMTEGLYTKGGQGNAGVAFTLINSPDGKNFNIEYQPRLETDEEFLKAQLSDILEEEKPEAVKMYKEMISSVNGIKGGIYKRDENILIDLKPLSNLLSLVSPEEDGEEPGGIVAGIAGLLKEGDYISLPAGDMEEQNEFVKLFKEPLEKIKKMGELIPDYEFKYLNYGKDYIEFKGQKSQIIEELRGVKDALYKVEGGKELADEMFDDGLEDFDPKSDTLLNFKVVFNDADIQITFDTVKVEEEKKAKVSGVINTRPSQAGTEFKKIEGNIIDLGSLFGGIGTPVPIDDDEDYEDYDDLEDAEEDDDIVIKD